MEEWKQIRQVYGFEISSKGRFRNVVTGNILKQRIGNTGYYQVSIRPGGRNCKPYCLKIHKLLAEAFIDNPDNKPHINHIDGNKTNNDLKNLEWVTHKENMQHARDMKLMKFFDGEDNGKAKLSEEDVEYIRKNFIPRDKTFGMRALSRKFNVHHSTIEKICHRVIWSKF